MNALLEMVLKMTKVIGYNMFVSPRSPVSEAGRREVDSERGRDRCPSASSVRGYSYRRGIESDNPGRAGARSDPPREITQIVLAKLSAEGTAAHRPWNRTCSCWARPLIKYHEIDISLTGIRRTADPDRSAPNLHCGQHPIRSLRNFALKSERLNCKI